MGRKNREQNQGLYIQVKSSPNQQDLADAQRLFAGISDPSAAGAVEQVALSCQNMNGLLYLAKKDGSRVAAAQVNMNYEEMKMASDNNAPELFALLRDQYRMIELIAVDPSVRGLGVGKELVRKIQRDLAARFIQYSTAVIEEHAESAGFFASLGFSVLEPGEPYDVPFGVKGQATFPIVPGYRWVVGENAIS